MKASIPVLGSMYGFWLDIILHVFALLGLMIPLMMLMATIDGESKFSVDNVRFCGTDTEKVPLLTRRDTGQGGDYGSCFTAA